MNKLNGYMELATPPPTVGLGERFQPWCYLVPASPAPSSGHSFFVTI